jgi:hypothetical protein
VPNFVIGYNFGKNLINGMMNGMVDFILRHFQGLAAASGKNVLIESLVAS